MPRLFKSPELQARLPLPQLFEFFQEQESECGVVAQAQKIWRETFPVREHALIAANFNKRVEKPPAEAQSIESGARNANCKPTAFNALQLRPMETGGATCTAWHRPPEASSFASASWRCPAACWRRCRRGRTNTCAKASSECAREFESQAAAVPGSKCYNHTRKNTRIMLQK